MTASACFICALSGPCARLRLTHYLTPNRSQAETGGAHQGTPCATTARVGNARNGVRSDDVEPNRPRRYPAPRAGACKLTDPMDEATHEGSNSRLGVTPGEKIGRDDWI